MKIDSFDDNIGICYFDPFSLFDNVKNEFLKLFPLNNVQWKSQSNLIKTRLIKNLPIDIYAEDNSNNSNKNNSVNSIPNRPLLKLIIVTCQSVDEYRAKIRPLLREWSFSESNQIESVTKLPFKSLILFYSNSKVIESNLFTSINILEKIKKDFPTSEVLELKSVYKSPSDKQTFWTHLQDNIKKYLLIIFERRLTFLNESLSKCTNSNVINNNSSSSGNSNNKGQQLYKKLKLQEQILILYMQFKLTDECQRQIDTIKMELNSFIDTTKEYGDLEYPFSFNLPTTLSDLLKTDKLTKFYCYKYFFIWDLKCYSIANNNDNSNNNYVQIERIYYTIRQFLRNSQILFPDDTNLIQFKYTIIDTILREKFPLLLSSQTSSTVYKSVMECKADLLLMKRDCWMEGVLATTNFKLLYKQYSNRNKIKFDIIDNVLLKDENRFHEEFISFNQELISLYNQCDSGRQRIVDILSLEIGMVYYQRGDYKNAILLFLSCYEYYIQSNWNMIGLQILKMFVESIEKCEKSNIKSLEFNGSKVSLDVILSHSYLNLLKLSDDPEERIIWWGKYIKLDSTQPVTNGTDPNNTMENVYAMDGVISFDIDKYVTMDQPNIYSIKLYIKDCRIPETIRVDSIKLTLQKRVSKEIKETVTFQNQEIELTHKLNNNKYMIQLNTKEINFGRFETCELTIKIGEKILTHKYNKEDSQTIYIEPIFHRESVRIKIEQEKCLKLGDNRLNIRFFNLAKISNFKLKLIVEKDDESVMYPISFHESDINDVTYLVDSKDSLRQIEEEEEEGEEGNSVCSLYGCITVPYYLQDSITTAFFIKTIFEFETTGHSKSEVYKETNHSLIQCYLPVSVSVEDIFKNQSFYFKFLLNSSIREEPVMLYGSELNGLDTVERVYGDKGTENDVLSDRYEILGHLRLEEPILLTSANNDSCINSYRVTTKKLKKFNPKDIFYLHVRYRTLKEELDDVLTDEVLNKDTERDIDGDIVKWTIFWELNILPRLQYDYERYYKEGLLVLERDSIDLDFIEKDLLRRICMEDKTRLTIIRCLKELSTTGYKMFEYNGNEKKKERKRDMISSYRVFERELIVPVELQSPRPFYLVQFEIDVQSSDLDVPQRETYDVGECIPFKITITDISDQWEEIQEEENGLYIFEIASSNDWLLHGKKRFAISRRSSPPLDDTDEPRNGPHVVNLSLIPLRTGHLNLPGIQMTSQDETQTIKTHQPNENDTVLVL